MSDDLPPDIRTLIDELAATERDAEALVEGLSEEQGGWRPSPEAWSVAECLDHLATANRVYVAAMRPAAERARRRGRWRRGPAEPGLLGGWFVKTLEPPVKPRRKLTAPAKIRPRSQPPLAAARADFFTEHRNAVAFLRENADLDLARIRFPNPFIAVIHWSLATGMHVIAAHERRHLLQAWRVRKAAAGGAAPAT
jgi:hypothetical protein